MVTVSKGGNDSTADGSDERPFLTIPAAMASITDASETKPYAIMVGPGMFAEAFLIKPWVGVVGVPAGSGFFGLTNISAPADTLGFAPFPSQSFIFSVSWYSHCVFDNHQTWNNITAKNNVWQLTFFACDFNNGCTFLGDGIGGVSNITMITTLIFKDVFVQGWQFFWTHGGTTFLGAAGSPSIVTIESGPVGANVATTWLSQNTTIGSMFGNTNVHILGNPATPAINAVADFSNTGIVGTVTVDGANTTYTSTLLGIPPTITVANSAPAVNSYDTFVKTTAQRNTASFENAIPQGFMVYDSTLKIPIWREPSAGTGWVNAAGAAV